MARAVTPAVCLYRVFSTWGAVRGEGGGAGRENKEAGVKEEMWRTQCRRRRTRCMRRRRPGPTS